MNLQDYNAQAEQFQPMAKVISWDVAKSTLMPRDVVLEMATQAGIPAKCFPKELRARAKFQRTLKTLSDEDFEQLEGVFHRITEDHEQSVWVWVTHEVDPRNSKISFTVERKFTFSKIDRTVTAEPPEALEAYRELFMTLDPESEEFSLVQNEILELENQQAETQQRLDDLMAHFGEMMLARDVRSFLTRCVQEAHGVPMRHQGGVYIVPRQMFSMVAAMKDFLAMLDPTGQSSLRVVNIVDVPTLASKLRTVATELGLDASDFHGLLDEISTSLSSRDDVASIFSSFEEHFVSQVQDISLDLDKLLEGERTPRQITLLSRLADLNQMREQAEMFSQLLDVESGKYKTQIDSLAQRLERYMTLAATDE